MFKYIKKHITPDQINSLALLLAFWVLRFNFKAVAQENENEASQAANFSSLSARESEQLFLLENQYCQKAKMITFNGQEVPVIFSSDYSNELKNTLKLLERGNYFNHHFFNCSSKFEKVCELSKLSFWPNKYDQKLACELVEKRAQLKERIKEYKEIDKNLGQKLLPISSENNGTKSQPNKSQPNKSQSQERSLERPLDFKEADLKDALKTDKKSIVDIQLSLKEIEQKDSELEIKIQELRLLGKQKSEIYRNLVQKQSDLLQKKSELLSRLSARKLSLSQIEKKLNIKQSSLNSQRADSEKIILSPSELKKYQFLKESIKQINERLSEINSSYSKKTPSLIKSIEMLKQQKQDYLKQLEVYLEMDFVGKD